MNKSGGVYRIGTGATSLMMILVILCLTALSVISYTSARSELAVARRDIYGRGDAKAYAQACQDAARQAGWTVEDSVCTVEIPATEKLSLRVQATLLPFTEEAARLQLTGFATVSQSEEMEAFF